MAIDTRIKWVALSTVEYEHQGETKTRFTRCGVAFWNKENAQGDQTLKVLLDAAPVNGQLLLMPDRPRDESGGGGGGGGGSKGYGR